jgi:transglutaminase-like putative cysteine protease
MDRRAFLRSGVAATTALASGRIARSLDRPATPGWRAFEVVMRVDLSNPSGRSRVWLPMPLVPDTDYHRNLGRSLGGNPSKAEVQTEPIYGSEIYCAEWEAGEEAPTAEVRVRFATRNRSLDLGRRTVLTPESKATLATYLQATRLIRTDGIVGETSRKITAGKTDDVEKARAIYGWIVENTFRDPKVRGCGVGDINAMLEARNLGGKCADLNALFVGLARAAGIPARDVYGIRVADSTEFKCLGRSGDITKAQHCRAEFYSPAHDWVPVDPADVRKVVLEENGGLKLDDPIVERARAKLFGSWEMNYLAFNRGHDLRLPASEGGPVDFFMYPQAETNGGLRKDCLDPQAFRYTITSRELGAPA